MSLDNWHVHAAAMLPGEHLNTAFGWHYCHLLFLLEKKLCVYLLPNMDLHFCAVGPGSSWSARLPCAACRPPKPHPHWAEFMGWLRGLPSPFPHAQIPTRSSKHTAQYWWGAAQLFREGDWSRLGKQQDVLIFSCKALHKNGCYVWLHRGVLS